MRFDQKEIYTDVIVMLIIKFVMLSDDAKHRSAKHPLRYLVLHQAGCNKQHMSGCFGQAQD